MSCRTGVTDVCRTFPVTATVDNVVDDVCLACIGDIKAMLEARNCYLHRLRILQPQSGMTSEALTRVRRTD